ncbi:hypothetical protein Glove_82g96 [Diversispora epigaea]|uniref:Galactose oxidase n=1 Tax=Diversispora epigaea TaxID=1348612 RepID=A0A397J7R0_9GLOM|nr:hypothetical protein Glove_82g96 [Diversispora epigaea]
MRNRFKLLFYFTFIWIYLLGYVTGYTPFARFAHTSAIIGEKLYICGGDIEGYSVSNISDFFYLDVSSNKTKNYLFNIDTLLWNELSNLNIAYTSWGTAVAGGINNTSFILFGGHMSPDNNSLVLSFNTITNTWSRPNITGNQPIRRRTTQAVINNSTMYIFGGSTDPFTDYPSLEFFNDMIILDTILWTWKSGSIVNAPSPRQGFSATMLPGGIIAYIGGTNENLTMVSMSEINLYDTTSDVWTLTNSTGNIPDPRTGHTALLSSNQQLIIVYGGIMTNNSNGSNISAEPQLTVLSITNFTWIDLVVFGVDCVPEGLTYHTANMVENYMFVAFGNITNQGASDGIYILDTSNYTWINSSHSSLPSPTPDSTLPYNLIVSNVVGGLALLGIISTISGILFKRKKKEKIGSVKFFGATKGGGSDDNTNNNNNGGGDGSRNISTSETVTIQDQELPRSSFPIIHQPYDLDNNNNGGGDGDRSRNIPTSETTVTFQELPRSSFPIIHQPYDLTRQSSENQGTIVEHDTVEHRFVIRESGEHEFLTGESGFTDESGKEVQVHSTEEFQSS